MLYELGAGVPRRRGRRRPAHRLRRAARDVGGPRRGAHARRRRRVAAATASATRSLEALEDEARELGLSRLFCLTFEVGFFGRHGFEDDRRARPSTPRSTRELVRSPRRGRRGVPRPRAREAEHARQHADAEAPLSAASGAPSGCRARSASRSYPEGMSTNPAPARRQPPQVYRRRRLLVLLGLVAVIVAIVLVIVRPGSSQGDEPDAAARRHAVGHCRPRPTPPTAPPTVIPTEPDRGRRRRVRREERAGRGRHRQDGVRGRRAAAALGDDHEHGQERVRAERRHQRAGVHDQERRGGLLGCRPTARSTRSTPRCRSRPARRSARACRSSGTARGRAPTPAMARANRFRPAVPRTTSRCRSTASPRRRRSSSSCTDSACPEEPTLLRSSP